MTATVSTVAQSTEYPDLILALGRDIRQGARGLGMRDARYLVDLYYEVQRFRISSAHMARTASEQAEPATLMGYMSDQIRRLEGFVAKALGEFAEAHPLGDWLGQIVGVGPVISAGLIAHTWEYDFRTVSALWRFAGLDPTIIWARGSRRPFNAKLKTLCYKIGESFVKFQAHPDGFYGKLFLKFKYEEWDKNITGKNETAALERAGRVGKGTTAYKWYAGQINPHWALEMLKSGTPWPERLPEEALGDGKPMLPPGHVNARARRRTVKLFLSHFWEVSYWLRHGQRPEDPWVIEHGGHTHKIEVPHAPWS